MKCLQESSNRLYIEDQIRSILLEVKHGSKSIFTTKSHNCLWSVVKNVHINWRAGWTEKRTNLLHTNLSD